MHHTRSQHRYKNTQANWPSENLKHYTLPDRCGPHTQSMREERRLGPPSGSLCSDRSRRHIFTLFNTTSPWSHFLFRCQHNSTASCLSRCPSGLPASLEMSKSLPNTTTEREHVLNLSEVKLDVEFVFVCFLKWWLLNKKNKSRPNWKSQFQTCKIVFKWNHD